MHDAIQRYADHVNDRSFKDPRPTLTQLLAADKSCRKLWEFRVSKGEDPEELIRGTIKNDRIWYQEISHVDYFLETGRAIPTKRKASASASQPGQAKKFRFDAGLQTAKGSTKGYSNQAFPKGSYKDVGKGGKVKGACYLHNNYRCHEGRCPQGYLHVCQVCGDPNHRKDFHN